MGEIIKAYMVPHPPIIVPEVGKGQESPAIATVNAYKTIAKQIGDLAPDVIIITTPHGTVYGDYIHISPDPVLKGDFRGFGASGVKLSFQNDKRLLESIVEKQMQPELTQVPWDKTKNSWTTARWFHSTIFPESISALS